MSAKAPHAPSRYVWHEWPEGSVVFDRLRGDTHTLDPLNALVLRALTQDASPDAAELQYALARHRPGLTAEQLCELLQDTRQQLALHGLIPHG